MGKQITWRFADFAATTFVLQRLARGNAVELRSTDGGKTWAEHRRYRSYQRIASARLNHPGLIAEVTL